MKDQDKSQAQLIAEVNELQRRLADMEARDTQMRTLLEQIPDGIFVTDMSGKFLEVNGRGCEMLGYEREELLSLGLLDIISPENLKEQPLRMEDLQARKMLYLDRVWRRKDGVDIPVEIQARMLPDGRTQAFVHDISDRKQAEAFLKESQERLDYALSTASDGFWDWNILTNEIYFSDHWCESLGYDPDEVPGMLDFWESLLHPDDKERVMANIKEHLAGKSENYLCEYRMLTWSGVYRQNLDRGRVVAWDEEGRPIRMVGTDTDISRPK